MNPISGVTSNPALTAATGSSTAANSTSNSNTTQLQGDDFMKLLLTQLRSQDPLQPMDPTEFVAQLVQLNSLQQLIGIHQLLQSATGTSTTPSAPTQGA